MPRREEEISALPVLGPEEIAEWKRLNEQRKKQEELEDIRYRSKQDSRLYEEISGVQKSRPDPLLMTPSDEKKIEEERRMVDEFVAKQKAEEAVVEKEKKKEEDELEKLMKDPSIIKQPPESGYKCMNQIEGEPCGSPATTKFVHGGLLGDLPPVTLCKDCSKLMKIIPLDWPESKPLDDAEIKRKKEVKKIQEKRKKEEDKRLQKLKQERPSRMRLRQSGNKNILKKIADLAAKLDQLGLYDEADKIDAILRSS